jgi:hypothetical protein
MIFSATGLAAPIMRDFLFRYLVFPSNVLERSDRRGKIIGVHDVVAGVCACMRSGITFEEIGQVIVYRQRKQMAALGSGQSKPDGCSMYNVSSGRT